MKVVREHTDQEIVALIIQGDRSACTWVYKEHLAALLSYVHRTVPIKEDCEEIVQEMFLSLWARREELHHVTDLRGYLFKMAKYKVVDYIRHDLVKKRYEEHYHLFGEMYDSVSGSEDEPDMQVLLEKIVLELPERRREAFRLRLDENLSNKEIAERMQISISAVEKHIAFAVEYIRTTGRNALKSG